VERKKKQGKIGRPNLFGFWVGYDTAGKNRAALNYNNRINKGMATLILTKRDRSLFHKYGIIPRVTTSPWIIPTPRKFAFSQSKRSAALGFRKKERLFKIYTATHGNPYFPFDGVLSDINYIEPYWGPISSVRKMRLNEARESRNNLWRDNAYSFPLYQNVKIGNAQSTIPNLKIGMPNPTQPMVQRIRMPTFITYLYNYLQISSIHGSSRLKPLVLDRYIQFIDRFIQQVDYLSLVSYAEQSYNNKNFIFDQDQIKRQTNNKLTDNLSLPETTEETVGTIGGKLATGADNWTVQIINRNAPQKVLSQSKNNHSLSQIYTIFHIHELQNKLPLNLYKLEPAAHTSNFPRDLYESFDFWFFFILPVYFNSTGFNRYPVNGNYKFGAQMGVEWLAGPLFFRSSNSKLKNGLCQREKMMPTLSISLQNEQGRWPTLPLGNNDAIGSRKGFSLFFLRNPATYPLLYKRYPMDLSHLEGHQTNNAAGINFLFTSIIYAPNRGFYGPMIRAALYRNLFYTNALRHGKSRYRTFWKNGFDLLYLRSAKLSGRGSRFFLQSLNRTIGEPAARDPFPFRLAALLKIYKRTGTDDLTQAGRLFLFGCHPKRAKGIRGRQDLPRSVVTMQGWSYLPERVYYRQSRFKHYFLRSGRYRLGYRPDSFRRLFKSAYNRFYNRKGWWQTLYHYGYLYKKLQYNLPIRHRFGGKRAIDYYLLFSGRASPYYNFSLYRPSASGPNPTVADKHGSLYQYVNAGFGHGKFLYIHRHRKSYKKLNLRRDLIRPRHATTQARSRLLPYNIALFSHSLGDFLSHSRRFRRRVALDRSKKRKSLIRKARSHLLYGPYIRFGARRHLRLARHDLNWYHDWNTGTLPYYSRFHKD